MSRLILPLVGLCLLASAAQVQAPLLSHLIGYLYEHIDYNTDPNNPGGEKITVEGGSCRDEESNLLNVAYPGGGNWNDRISSVEVVDATCEIKLYQHIGYNADPNNPGGDTITCTFQFPLQCKNLVNAPIQGGGNWNDQASAFWAQFN